MGVLNRAIGVALVTALAACTDFPSHYPTSVIAPAAPGGASRDRLQRIVDSLVSAYRIPGAAVFVQRAESDSYTLTTGVDDVAAQTAMNAADRFRVGGVTFTMVATVAMQLMDEGKLSLDDTIARWLPAAGRNAARTTVRQLLNHTAGLPDYANDALFDSTMAADPAHVWGESDLVSVADRLPPAFAPGVAWQLSSTDCVAMGLIVEAVTGQSLDAVLHARIFDPLGLTSTYYATTPATPSPFARGYAGVWDRPVADVSALVSPTSAGASGAVVSSLPDLERWAAAFASGQLLSPAMRVQWLSGVPTSGLFYYGLGTETFNGWVGHSGAFPGYEAQMFARPGVGTIIVLINGTTPSSTGSYAIFDALRWAEFGNQ